MAPFLRVSVTPWLIVLAVNTPWGIEGFLIAGSIDGVTRDLRFSFFEWHGGSPDWGMASRAWLRYLKAEHISNHENRP